VIALKVTDHDTGIFIMQLLEYEVITPKEARYLIIKED